MLLGTAIAGFLQHLRVVRRLSGHTVAGYGRDLRALERALPGATVEGVGGRMVPAGDCGGWGVGGGFDCTTVVGLAVVFRLLGRAGGCAG